MKSVGEREEGGDREVTEGVHEKEMGGRKGRERRLKWDVGVSGDIIGVERGHQRGRGWGTESYESLERGNLTQHDLRLIKLREFRRKNLSYREKTT